MDESGLYGNMRASRKLVIPKEIIHSSMPLGATYTLLLFIPDTTVSKTTVIKKKEIFRIQARYQISRGTKNSNMN